MRRMVPEWGSPFSGLSRVTKGPFRAGWPRLRFSSRAARLKRQKPKNASNHWVEWAATAGARLVVSDLSGKSQVRVDPLIEHNGGILGARNQLLFGPGGESGNLLRAHRIQGAHGA